ncbi:MAG TPA: V-type ATP synthase subunit A [Candidatus Hydrogenedentes bacterium]|nr:V-type ATP synthase subunit A [Candidatus Hydrogenedentota bacterium]HPO86153.1 V-type ATP synthase subunit A [Candidatus Hydrogenedentota bacterium]
MTLPTRTECIGKIVRIAGSMISASGMHGVAMGEVLRVGKAGLLGEVIRIDGDTVDAQVFEDTQGMFLGEPVVPTGTPLSVELGPGLLGGTFDGIQRPLSSLQKQSGDFISRGLTAPALDRSSRWLFTPTAQNGQEVTGGDILGTVPEKHFVHRILVPPKVKGVVREIAPKGEYGVDDVIAVLDGGVELRMLQVWPIKEPRPILKKLPVDRPFLTGQRVLDCLFPIALGGTAIVPGGFGTGKTVVEQTLAKYCNADIIVYIGCGERGNEMADVLDEFPHLKDPKTGGPLMDRTILVVNTSNMPVAARDASVYTGVAIAEYYRDQGYDVALMADSTSRWAEALREIASRLEEMPGEEGYPTYLAARIAAFYERSGRVECLETVREGEPPRCGSLTIVGAVSPAGGDYSEPVTQTSLRVAGALWALDATLAYRRHYPAVNWNRSYTLYLKELEEWFSTHAPAGWTERRRALVELLQRDAELQEVVQLVGPDALQDAQRLVLETARLVREVFLQQNAFSDADAYSSLPKTSGLLEAVLAFYQAAREALEKGMVLSDILRLPLREDIARLRDVSREKFEEARAEVMKRLEHQFSNLVTQRSE